MLLVRNIRLPLSCPDPDAEAAAQALHILRVPAHKAARCGVAKLSVDARHGKPVLVMEPVNGNCTGDFCTWKKCVQEKVIMLS